MAGTTGGAAPPPQPSSRSSSPTSRPAPTGLAAESKPTHDLPPPAPPGKAQHQGKTEGRGGSTLSDPGVVDVDVLIEEEKRTLTALLTEEFNQKCEKYYALFREKDSIVEEQSASLRRMEQELQAANARQGQLEASLQKEGERCHQLEESLRQREEELVNFTAELEQWRAKDAKYTGREYER